MRKISAILAALIIGGITVATVGLAPLAAEAKIQSVDTGSENPAGFAAPGQQPTATGQGQIQESENQNPAGKAPRGQNK